MLLVILLESALLFSEAGHRAEQCQVLTVTGSGQPVRSYKAIQSLWLPLLGLNAHEKDKVVHQGWLSPALGPGQISKSPKPSQDPPPASAAGCLLGSLT